MINRRAIDTAGIVDGKLMIKGMDANFDPCGTP